MTAVGSQVGSKIISRERERVEWYHQSDTITRHDAGKEVMQMDEPKTLTVPEAGRRYFDLGRNASYEAAKRGEIPTIRIGRLLRVPIVALERKLAECDRR
jgi:hypothetical protein